MEARRWGIHSSRNPATVEPRVLVQAVKRNRDRLPVDFMFQLTKEEFDHLKSQIVTSSWGGARRGRPDAFTEQGGDAVERPPKPTCDAQGPRPEAGSQLLGRLGQRVKRRNVQSSTGDRRGRG